MTKLIIITISLLIILYYLNTNNSDGNKNIKEKYSIVVEDNKFDDPLCGIGCGYTVYETPKEIKRRVYEPSDYHKHLTDFIASGVTKEGITEGDIDNYSSFDALCENDNTLENELIKTYN